VHLIDEASSSIWAVDYHNSAAELLDQYFSSRGSSGFAETEAVALMQPVMSIIHYN